MLSNRLKLRHIKYFVSLAQEESYSRTAVKLSVTQPAVTKTIKELEDILQVTLVDRSSRQFALTTEGNLYYQHALQTVGLLQRASLELEHARDKEQGSVKIGVLPTAAAHVIPRVTLSSLAVNIYVDAIFSRNKPELLSSLVDGNLDLVLARLPDANQMNGLAFEHLYYDRLVFVVRSNHPLIERESVGVEELAHYLTILPEKSAQTRNDAIAFLMSRNIAQDVTSIEDKSETVCREIVFQSDTIWVVPESVVASDLKLGSLVRLPIDSSITIGSVGLISVAGKEQKPEVSMVAAMIKAA